MTIPTTFQWKGTTVHVPFGAEGAATKAAPTTPKEWEDYVNTSLATPEAFKKEFDSGNFTTALKGYQGASNKTMDGIKAELLEQTQASIVEMFKRNGADITDKPNLAARAGTAYNNAAPGAELDRRQIWAGPGQMLRDVLTNARMLKDDQIARLKKYDEFANAYSSSVPSEGGYLIPEEVRSDIMTVALEEGIVRPRAHVVPMSTGRLRYPVLDFTTEVGEVFGGIVMSWLDEGQEIPETSSTFAAIELIAHKLGGLASLPNELINDAKALESWLRQAMPQAIRHFEDIGFLKGDGVKKPLGALHADNPALIVVGDESGQSTPSITWVNVLTMFSRFLPESFEKGLWIITPDAIPEIFTMALPVGTGGSAVMIGEGGGPQRPAMTLLGMPIKWSRKAPAVLGTQGDISLVDLSKYVVGDTQQLSLDASEHSSFKKDKTDFRIVERIDGQPGMLEAITPENGGPTLSAFVQLETRSLD
jgi:HK97 family phage major capsid protein